MSQNLNLTLEKVAAGDADAFRKLFEKYSGKVYIFALKLTHSSSLAEEIMQDIFLNIWLYRAKLKDVRYFPSYLYKVTKNHTFNILKRLALEQRAKLHWQQEFQEAHAATEQHIFLNEYQALLNKAVETLPPQQRTVYALCHKEGMKYEEVAQQLKISRLTVKSHMQQALRVIRTHLNHLLAITLVYFLN
jgi:RNA polymerase sigma-70 factor (family 1)